ncbi:unnamed protein product [Brassica napus]|uniref:(rape) hypothetical protein n=1 Tax=Brassica napus TaxID=3708 RepID=A0A816VWT6_BRANA|nr:unnamed protein product [Brassica napus]
MYRKVSISGVRVQSKACEASNFVAKHGTSYYRQLLEKNKQYIQEPATVEKCQELSKQLLYTRLARFLSPSLLPLSKSQISVSSTYCEARKLCCKCRQHGVIFVPVQSLDQICQGLVKNQTG